MKQIGIWIVITIVIVLGVIGLAKASGSPSSTSTGSSSIPKISSSDNAVGGINAKVQIVEYADFQCPSCLVEYPVLKNVTTKYGNKILFAYRYFPLTQIHQNAMASALAAYASAQQGKFWQMHDKLFATQSSWAQLSNASDTFLGYAKDLSLDLNKYKAAIADPKASNLINNEETIGTNAGVNATPTLFINGKMIQSDHVLSESDIENIVNPILNGK